MKAIYYICIEDSYGQRTGNYREVRLEEDEINIDRFGHKTWKGHFLFEKLIDVIRACQD